MVGFTVSALLLGSTVAAATNWGSTAPGGTPTNAVSLLPNSTMVVQRVNLTSANNTAVSAAAINQYLPTELILCVPAGTGTCATGQRACVFDGEYGNNGLLGWATCGGTSAGTNPNRTCTRPFVRLNLTYNPVSRQRLACHELGHTVGLRHSTQTASCMITNIANGTTSALTAHDSAHINARY